MKISFTLSLIFLFTSLYCASQDFDEFLQNHKTEPVQKIYLHTDREYYSSGDTLWFAAYLVNGSDHVPVTGNSNLYLELINQEGEVIQDAIFTVFDGIAQGYLPIDRNQSKRGNYLLRSFNDYLRNFGDDYYFSKIIGIDNFRNATEFKEPAKSDSASQDIRIDFYPEGGFLLAEKVNQVAFKVSGLENEEEMSGSILDDKGTELTRFSTLYKSMGKLFFAPESEVEYTVKLDGYPGREWKMPAIHTEGAKIVATLIDSAYVNLSIVHSESEVTPNYHIAVLNRGEGLLFITLDAARLDKMIRLTNDYFGEGINRVILLDENLSPVSERLIFRNKGESVDLDLSINKSIFKNREEVVLHLLDSDQLLNNENAELSVVVVDNNALSAGGMDQNIKSYLLLDSELKGQVNNPLDYFTNNENVSALLKQDLLMLTQGWSNYIWNDLENEKVVIDSFGFGLTFKGKLMERKSHKAIPESDVFLRLNSKTQSNLLFTFTDEQGDFMFPKVFFSDTAYYQIQGNNSKGQLNAIAELAPLINSPVINPGILNSLNKFESVPQSYSRLKFRNDQALKEFYPDQDSRVIEEIKVTGKEKEDDGHYRIYNTPSVSITVTKQDLAYTSIFQFLQGRASGVQVTGDRVIIHGFSSFGVTVDVANDPLYLLDGIPIDKSMVSGISMSAVDKVEVLKSNEAAMFGSRGSTGVISILSKSNGNFGLGMSEFPAGVYEKIIGFAPYREFYSPQYSDSNKETKVPDYRTTLYWNPSVQLINGQAVLSFFTCDNLSDYTIFVEGITSLGRTLLGSRKFEVE